MQVNKGMITLAVVVGFSCVLILGFVLKTDTLQHYMINRVQDARSLFKEHRYQGQKEEDPCPLLGAGWFTPKRIRSTALTSFPGSGNTWTRYLLTAVTGILTGTRYSVEATVTMYPKGKAYRVLVVKTHEMPEKSRTLFPFDRCLLLIRNPYDALLADFNRLGRRSEDKTISEHKTIRPAEDFKKEWPKYVSARMKGWSSLYVAWLSECKPPNLHALVYSRMTENLGRELDLAFRFLNESIITPRIHCATQHSEGKDHRGRHDWQKNVAIFTQPQKQLLNSAIDRVQTALEKATGQNFDDLQAWKR